MTKTFCDKCGEQINGENFIDTFTEIDHGRTRIIVALVGPSEICFSCVFDAIAALDDRPKAAPTYPLPPRADESALGPQGPQSLDAKLFIGGKEVQPIDPGKAHDFRAFETSGGGIGAYHYCLICGNHKSHPLHRPLPAEAPPPLKRHMFINGAAMNIHDSCAICGGAPDNPVHVRDPHTFVARGDGWSDCAICGSFEDHVIHHTQPHDFVPSPDQWRGCAVCGTIADHPIHHPPDVQNVPALFGGSVKE